MKTKKIKATYRNGVIEPFDKINLPEGQELEVEFRVLPKTPHELTREEEKATQTYTALIRESEGWWIGWILEVRGVTCQERTRSELLDTLQITLREILEDEMLEVSRRTENESEAVKASDILEFGVQDQIKGGFEEVSIAICWAESESKQKQAPATRKNPAAQRLIKATEKPPHLTNEDIEALNQSIKEGKIPIKFDSPFEPNAHEE